MNRKLFSYILSVSIFAVSNSHVQTTQIGKWYWGLGIEPGLSIGAMHNYGSFELGGTVRT